MYALSCLRNSIHKIWMQEEERQPLSSSQLLWNWKKAQTHPETLQHSGLQPAYVSDLRPLEPHFRREETIDYKSATWMELTWTLAVLTGGRRRSGVPAVKPAGSSVTRPGWCSACRRNIMEPTSSCTANTAPKTVQTPGDPVTTPYVRPSGGQGHGLR